MLVFSQLCAATMKVALLLFVASIFASILTVEGKDQYLLRDTDVTNDGSTSFVLKPEDEVLAAVTQLMEIERVGPYFFTTERYNDAVEVLALVELEMFRNDKYSKYSISQFIQQKSLVLGYDITSNKKLVKVSRRDGGCHRLIATPSDYFPSIVAALDALGR